MPRSTDSSPPHRAPLPASRHPGVLRAVLVFPVLCLGLLVACKTSDEAPQPLLYSFQGTTMGTYYVAKVVQPPESPLDGAAQEALLEVIEQELEAVNGAMSTYQDDSELSRFNAAPAGEPFVVSQETFRVFATAIEMNERSRGTLDVTVGPLVNAWGFGPGLEPTEIPDAHRPQELLSLVGLEHLSLDPTSRTVTKAHDGVYCDLSSLAKGFAVDQVVETLIARGHRNVMVEVGGEVRASGANLEGKPWRLGIESPAAARGQVQRIVALQDRAMATSGDYRNYTERNGVRLSHLIDPRTGRPIDHRLASVSVVDESCMTADAWATALMILGPEEGLSVADELGLAVLFLVREDESFQELPSRAFAADYLSAVAGAAPTQGQGETP